MERVGGWIVSLDASAPSTSATSSRVVSSDGSNLLVTNYLLVSFCSRETFNGALEVGA